MWLHPGGSANEEGGKMILEVMAQAGCGKSQEPNPSAADLSRSDLRRSFPLRRS
jgi:hypothetical protein